MNQEEPRRALDFQEKKAEVLRFLASKDHAVMALATSHNDRVMARNVLIASHELDLYFFTWGRSRKCVQIRDNSSVALCKEDVQIEGEAEILGDLLDEKNQEYADILRRKLPDSVRKWEDRPGMVVVRIRPTLITTAGGTIDGEIYLDYLDLRSQIAYAEKWAHF